MICTFAHRPHRHGLGGSCGQVRPTLFTLARMPARRGASRWPGRPGRVGSPPQPTVGAYWVQVALEEPQLYGNMNRRRQAFLFKLLGRNSREDQP